MLLSSLWEGAQLGEHFGSLLFFGLVCGLTVFSHGLFVWISRVPTAMSKRSETSGAHDFKLDHQRAVLIDQVLQVHSLPQQQQYLYGFQSSHYMLSAVVASL